MLSYILANNKKIPWTKLVPNWRKYLNGRICIFDCAVLTKTVGNGLSPTISKATLKHYPFYNMRLQKPKSKCTNRRGLVRVSTNCRRRCLAPVQCIWRYALIRRCSRVKGPIWKYSSTWKGSGRRVRTACSLEGRRGVACAYALRADSACTTLTPPVPITRRAHILVLCCDNVRTQWHLAILELRRYFGHDRNAHRES